MQSSFFAALRAARTHNTGLLFSYPLGLLPSVMVSVALVLFSEMPEKGIYAGGNVGESFGLEFSCGFMMLIFLTSWITTVYIGRNRPLWPRRTSFLFGSLIGFLVGLFGSFILLSMLIPAFLLFLVVAEIVATNPVVCGILLFLMYLWIKKERRREKSDL
jgi:hypothetical protein